MTRYAFTLSFLLFGFQLLAQHHEHHTTPDSSKQTSNPQKINSLQSIFTKGHLHGHFRNYFMATVNYQELSDFYANGVGGLVEYETADCHGFKVGLSGLFIFNLFSSDFTKVDEITGKYSRYELELFDVERPENRSDLDRLDELYLQYRFKNSFIKFGKQGIHTPMMNMQDTRMKPYVLEGIWTELKEVNSLKINAGWFYKASVRSTTEWLTLAESIGIYEQGVNPDGSASYYKHHVHTKGVGILGLTFSKTPKFKGQFWNYWIENISNSTFLQTDFAFPISGEKDILLGGQLLRQQAINHGGNSDIHKTYFQPNQTNYVFSLQTGIRSKISEFTLNYLKADKNGRFTFPREWGRENFYTTVFRGRIEGMGNVQTLMAIWKYHPNPKLFFRVDLGQVFAPGYDDYQFNKYGNISTTHLNLNAVYIFDKKWNGLKIGFLYTHKKAMESYTDNLAPLYYNGNYHHFNLVTNIEF